MGEIINDGYDMPDDVNHESRNWWGLSDRHFGMAVIGVCIIGIWYRVCMLFGLNGLTLIFMQGVIVIAVLVVSAAALKLDQWVVRVIRWYFQPYQVMHDDKDVTELSGVLDIEGDHFLSSSGKICAILQLTAIGNNRVDPEKQETTLACDRDFLNALPCAVQIMGRNFNFDIGAYIAKRLKGSDRLSPKAHALKIDHLNFIQEYIKENEIRDKIELMVLGVNSDRSQPIDELNTNVDIIVANLATSGVIGRRLYGSEIAAVTIMLCTGVGQSAMDYLSPYMDVEQE